MLNLFESADRYLDKSDWRDLAVIKFCLCAMGVLLGTSVPEKHRQKVFGFAAGVFCTTYVILMKKYLSILFTKE